MEGGKGNNCKTFDSGGARFEREGAYKVYVTISHVSTSAGTGIGSLSLTKIHNYSFAAVLIMKAIQFQCFSLQIPACTFNPRH